MNGSLALVGSGEYLPAMAEFEKSLIADGVKKQMKAKFVQIPTAAGQESDSRLAYWQQLGQVQADLIGASCVFLPIYTREDAYNLDYAEQIKDSALIYLSGGDPHYLANSLINTPVWSAILSNWEKGGSLAGCSAGAMVLSSQIPHFNKFFKWIPESAAKLLLNVPEDSILIGIDELTAIVKRSGETNWQVYGQAMVHFLKGLDQQKLANGEQIKLV